MIRVMDLFSGVGGFSLGLKRAGPFKTICYCEIEPYCQKVLQARMRDGSLDTAPICSDITKLDGEPWRGRVDLISGGFPCQDISIAGKAAGLAGERGGLWREMARLIRQVRPRYVFVENVSMLLARGMGDVLGDLASYGYNASWVSVCSCLFGTAHCRERLYIVADSSEVGNEGFFRDHLQYVEVRQGGADATPNLLHDGKVWRHKDGSCAPEPVLFGERDVVPSRLDRIGALGNSVVPQIVEWIGRRILECTAL